MKTTAIRLLSLAALLTIVGAAAPAQAGLITYNYTTTLVLRSGTDSAGLTGATLSFTAEVSSTAVYVDRFGFPAVAMNNNATLTISGASVAANNGVYAVEPLAFFPTFAGLFTEPNGSNPIILLNSGHSLVPGLNTIATAVGATAAVGQTVELADFGPATSFGTIFILNQNVASYNQRNVVITATLTPDTVAVPEPSTLSLAFAAAMGTLAGVRSLRKRRSA